MGKIRKFLNSVLSRLTLWGTWLIFLGVMLYIAVSNDLLHVQIEKRLGAQEIISRKPPITAILINDVNVKAEGGLTAGRLFKNTLVYLEASPENAKDEVATTLYGWIWAKSVEERGGFLVLNTEENIRFKANSVVLGRLKVGTILLREYLNEARSWYLFKTRLLIPFSELRFLPSSKDTGIWAWLKAPRSIVTVTSKVGGVSATHTIIEPRSTLLCLSFIILTLYLGIRRQREEYRKELYLELAKAGLQIVVGVILAFLIFGLGLKQYIMGAI